MPYPQDKTILGIGKEVTKGTPVVAADLIPVTSLQAFRNIRQLDDTGWRGSMVTHYGQIQGPWSTEVTFNGDVYADLIGYLYKCILGDETLTGASPPYSHAIAVLNSTDGQPPPYTLHDFYGPVTRQFPYCLLSQLDIKYAADGKINYSAKAIGRADSTVATPVLSYTTQPPIAAWITTATLFGTSLVVLSGDVNIRRAVSAIPALGNQDANVVWGGAVECTGKLTCLMLDDTLITGYIANTQGALVLNSAQGAGAAAVQHQITASKAAIKVAKPSRAADAMRVDVDFTAIANLTDAGASGGYSPFKFLAGNARSTAY